MCINKFLLTISKTHRYSGCSDRLLNSPWFGITSFTEHGTGTEPQVFGYSITVSGILERCSVKTNFSLIITLVNNYLSVLSCNIFEMDNG